MSKRCVYSVVYGLFSSARAKAALAACSIGKLVDLNYVGSEHGRDNHLSNALKRLDNIRLVGNVAETYADLAAVVAVDHSYAV